MKPTDKPASCLGDVRVLILNPMVKTYEAPRHLTDPKAMEWVLLRQYADPLIHYAPETLAKVWRHVAATHTGWTWPTPAAFLTAARLVTQGAVHG